MAAPPTTSPDVVALREHRLREHKEQVARLREEFGDPAEALNKIILDVFTIEAFLPDDWSPGDEIDPVLDWRAEDDDQVAW